VAVNYHQNESDGPGSMRSDPGDGAACGAD
jgi:hypothetical protein